MRADTAVVSDAKPRPLAPAPTQARRTASTAAVHRAVVPGLLRAPPPTRAYHLLGRVTSASHRYSNR